MLSMVAYGNAGTICCMLMLKYYFVYHVYGMLMLGHYFMYGMLLLGHYFVYGMLML